MPKTHDPSTRITRIVWPLLAAFGLSFSGAAYSVPSSAATAPDRSDPLHGAHQLVLVTTAGWDDNQGTLRRFERPDDAAPWHQVASFPVSIGRAGSAWRSSPAPAGHGLISMRASSASWSANASSSSLPISRDCLPRPVDCTDGPVSRASDRSVGRRQPTWGPGRPASTWKRASVRIRECGSTGKSVALAMQFSERSVTSSCM